jgi:hypothetical protein
MPMRSKEEFLKNLSGISDFEHGVQHVPDHERGAEQTMKEFDKVCIYILKRIKGQWPGSTSNWDFPVVAKEWAAKAISTPGIRPEMLLEGFRSLKPHDYPPSIGGIIAATMASPLTDLEVQQALDETVRNMNHDDYKAMGFRNYYAFRQVGRQALCNESYAMLHKKWRAAIEQSYRENEIKLREDFQKAVQSSIIQKGMRLTSEVVATKEKARSYLDGINKILKGRGNPEGSSEDGPD